jgi:hypothetical protein
MTAIQELPSKLDVSTQQGDLEKIKLILNDIPNMNLVYPNIYDRYLCIGAQYGYIEIVKYFIQNGANIHIKNELPLALASYNGYLEIVKYLVEKGANFHINDEYPMRLACTKGHSEIVKYFIEEGAYLYPFDDGEIFMDMALKGNTELANYIRPLMPPRIKFNTSAFKFTCFKDLINQKAICPSCMEIFEKKFLIKWYYRLYNINETPKLMCPHCHGTEDFHIM